MIRIPNTLDKRLGQFAALASAYDPSVKVPFLRRNRWLFAAVAWATVTVVVASLVSGKGAWFDGFSGNLIAGALGSVVFGLIGAHFNAENARQQSQTHRRIEALAAREHEDHLIGQFVTHLESGEVGDIYVHRPRSGPDGLLYQVQAIMDPSAQKPLRFGRPRDNVFVIRVTAPPLLANTRQHREEYAKSAIESGTHYFCRFQDRAWHMGKTMMRTHDWFEFVWAGTGAELVPSTTADEFVTQVSRTR